MSCNKIIDDEHFQSIDDNRVLQYFAAVDIIKIFHYKELRIDSCKFTDLLNKNRPANGFQQNVIVFLSMHSPALLPAIVGITNAGDACCFVEPSINHIPLMEKCEQFRSGLILCDAKTAKIISTYCNLVVECDLFNEPCFLLQVRDENFDSANKITATTNIDLLTSSNVFFYASTSGSCGQTKSIGVTFKCFMPNIETLTFLYGLTENDVIFVSSPSTFDPFMVDICLALRSGACLAMASNALRCDPPSLLNVLFPIPSNEKSAQSRITVMQTTPSLFQRWTTQNIKHQILSPLSSLRILAFGGEPFPSINAICNWFEFYKPRLFNLYGLTEMSCWASIYEVSNDDLIQKNDIPIGAPIDDHTILDIDDENNELLLRTTTRKCFQPQLSEAQVVDDCSEFILRTGDIVEKRNGGIYFKSRSNSVIKIFGQKLDTSQVEGIVKSAGEDDIIESVCLLDISENAVHLFARSPKTHGELLKRRLSLLVHEKVNAFIRIHIMDEFPLTDHGKINKTALLDMVRTKSEKSSDSVHALFLQLLNEVLGTEISTGPNQTGPLDGASSKKSKGTIDASFIFLGGSSLKAIQIVDQTERLTSSTMSNLLPMLLDENVSLREILTTLHCPPRTQQSVVENYESLVVPEIVYKWSVDMGKCIDATPTICPASNGESILSVGSHSKLLFNIRISSGEILSQLELPDRIECQVTQIGWCGIIGCYDGHLYCFDILTGEMKWKFDSNGMIKSRPIIIDSMILFGNYNDDYNLWCLNGNDGSLVWRKRVGTKSIFAGLLQFDEWNFVACTLDGVVVLVDVKSVEVLWSFSAKCPIFSTPIIFIRDLAKFVIVAGVNGNIFCINATGMVIWTYSIDGNIFSSFDRFSIKSKGENSDCLVFGSQNKFVYCLQISSRFDSCRERWKSQANASIRPTPFFAEFAGIRFIVNCSSDGNVQFIQSDSGEIICQYRVKGALFSNPIISKTDLFIASRNNKLYCVDLREIFRNKI